MIVPTDDDLRRLYAESRTIAVAGCSGQWPKPSHVVPAYMLVTAWKAAREAAWS